MYECYAYLTMILAKIKTVLNKNQCNDLEELESHHEQKEQNENQDIINDLTIVSSSLLEQEQV